VALLVVLSTKLEAINPIKEYLKLSLILAEGVCLFGLILPIDKAEKRYYSPFIARPHYFFLFPEVCEGVKPVTY
jgi:hypothetical protein